jgi:hypothetical protein
VHVEEVRCVAVLGNCLYATEAVCVYGDFYGRGHGANSFVGCCHFGFVVVVAGDRPVGAIDSPEFFKKNVIFSNGICSCRGNAWEGRAICAYVGIYTQQESVFGRAAFPMVLAARSGKSGIGVGFECSTQRMTWETGVQPVAVGAFGVVEERPWSGAPSA